MDQTPQETPEQTPTVTCPSCGYASPIGTPLCGNCGYALGSPIASGRSGGTGFLVIAVALLGLGGLIWGASGWIGDQFDDFGTSGSGSGEEAVESEQQTIEGPYANVRDVAQALNEGGLPCTQVKVDFSDEIISTGSCQAPGEFVRTHVQINIYFNQFALASSIEIMGEGAFTYVHDDNWFVITQPATARKVHRILGGSLSLAK